MPLLRNDPLCRRTSCSAVKATCGTSCRTRSRKFLSQLLDERSAASIKEANERLAEKIRAFNDRPLEIDPSLTRRALFEGKEREFLKMIPAIPWGEDIEVKQKGGTVRYNQRRYRVNYRYIEEYVNVVACESDQTVRIFTDKKWNLIGELSLRDGTNLTIEDVEKQSSGSRFMQLKAAELIGNIRAADSNSQALYMQLAAMTDKLASARYARFIDKCFSEFGTERFEKILEEPRDLGAGWELEELKDKLTNAGKKEIVSIRRRAGQVLQREQGADQNLGGAEHYESILRERKVES